MSGSWTAFAGGPKADAFDSVKRKVVSIVGLALESDKALRKVKIQTSENGQSASGFRTLLAEVATIGPSIICIPGLTTTYPPQNEALAQAAPGDFELRWRCTLFKLPAEKAVWLASLWGILQILSPSFL